MVESSSDEILHNADKSDVAFLVVGDPFGHVPLQTGSRGH
jgi:diphthine synthase